MVYSDTAIGYHSAHQARHEPYVVEVVSRAGHSTEVPQVSCTGDVR